MLRTEAYHKLTGFFMILLTLGMPFCIFATASHNNTTLEQAVDALLKSSWKDVADTLQKDDKYATDPIARLIMGHASIATNQNNTALRLFISVGDDTQFKLWSEWTGTFLEEHPESAVALYLAADARARMQKFSEAETLFTKALLEKPDFGLAYCGRGITRLMQEKEDLALLDFIQAVNVSPNLADAHANLGTYWVLKEAPEGALKEFEKALKIDPDFALAYNGRGCVRFGCGQFEEAIHDFNFSYKMLPELSLLQTNEGLALAYRFKVISLSYIESKPGVTLETVVNSRQNGPANQESAAYKDTYDTEFANKIRAFAHLKPNEQGAFIQKYGPEKVEMAIRTEMERLASDITKINSETQKLRTSIGRLTWGSMAVKASQATLSVVSGTASATENIKAVGKEGWKPFWRKTAVEMGKTAASAVAPNRTASVVLDAVPTSLDPVSLGVSATGSALHVADSVLDDKLGAVDTKQSMFAQQVGLKSLQFRNLQNAYNKTFLTQSSRLASQKPIQNRVIPRSDSTVIPRGGRMGGPPGSIGIGRRPLATSNISMSSPKPGGISTKELAKAFVDRGNWPVRSCFGLLYFLTPEKGTQGTNDDSTAQLDQN